MIKELTDRQCLQVEQALMLALTYVNLNERDHTPALREQTRQEIREALRLMELPDRPLLTYQPAWIGTHALITADQAL